MIVQNIIRDGDRHRGSVPEAVGSVGGVETAGIHPAAHLQEAQLLIGPAPEYGANCAIGHDDRPVVLQEKVQESSHHLSDQRAHIRVDTVWDQVISDA